ncbi:MAG: hypothetical protein EA398_01635 [Deltaproteobacteria bacterium]|nr:MAG: hypothetical protein EA398_01635 [Deltaproteobacteria bacterium]
MRWSGQLGQRRSRGPWRLLVLSLTVLLGLVLPGARDAHALPHMSLLAGAPCATCHVNEQGAGMRTNIGFGSMSHVGALQWEDVGLPWLSDRVSNEVVDYLVSVGMDARIQTARIGRPLPVVDEAGELTFEQPPRETFLMQLQPYLAVTPHDVLTLYGTWNAGRETFREGDPCDTPYPGQQCFEAMAIVHPGHRMPGVRLGMLQPSVGIRHDDHTMKIRQEAYNTVVRRPFPVIPANYAEWGAEAFWQPRFDVRAELGVFHARGLSEGVGDPSVVDPDDVALAIRLQWMPQFELGSTRWTSWLGGSVYGGGDFRMDNAFAGLGWMDRGALILEAAHMHFGSGTDRRARNLSAQLTVQTWEWLLLQGRAEQAWSRDLGDRYNTLAFVGGVQFFPLPFIEIRPEYRWEETDVYRTGQYTVQMHFFY